MLHGKRNHVRARLHEDRKRTSRALTRNIGESIAISDTEVVIDIPGEQERIGIRVMEGVSIH